MPIIEDDEDELAESSYDDPSAPCAPWITAEELCCDLPEGEGAAERIALCIDAASSILYRLGGSRHGVCTIEETFTAEGCGPPRPPGDDRWGGWLDDTLTLGVSPVHEVTSLTVDGVDVLAGQGVTWVLEDFRKLVRIDGGSWSGEVVVGYPGGVPVPASGKLAADELTCELLKACGGDDTCKLPARVQQIARGGIVVPFIDPMDFLDHGRLGLTLCDMFITAENPQGLTARSRIVNPDDFARGSRRRG